MEKEGFNRKLRRSVLVGEVRIGGGAPVSIQSMTNTFTHDVDRTIAQINALADAGSEIVRVAVPTRKDTDALKKIVENSPVPIVADVHFSPQRAIEAIEAGVHKIRLNPGNIKKKSDLKRIISAAKLHKVPIRIGVNIGSIREASELSKEIKGDALIELALERLKEYIGFFEENRFEDIVLSAKSSDVLMTIELYRRIASSWDYPLHLGLTHSGTIRKGSIRSSVAIGVLLFEGIGDTVRVSLAGDPIEEVYVAKEILRAAGVRDFEEPELICCPTCGRCSVDLAAIAADVERRLRSIKKRIRVAVMGCVVNGPGEAADADIALVAGRGCFFIYKASQRLGRVSLDKAVDLFIECCYAIANGRDLPKLEVPGSDQG